MTPRVEATVISRPHTAMVFLAACLVGCVAPAVKDYEKFYQQAPFTVVVLPVDNHTADVEAPRFFLATITKPLVDRGYYVMPVEATAAILTAEGLGDGGSLAAVDPRKFHDYLGADAVLYVTLLAWDTVYAVFASGVTVSLAYKLVSTGTGDVLWETQQTQTIQSNSGGGGGGIGGLIAMAVNAAVTAAATDYVPMAMQANVNSCATLPPGPYNGRFEGAKKDYLERAKKKKGASSSDDS